MQKLSKHWLKTFPITSVYLNIYLLAHSESSVVVVVVITLLPSGAIQLVSFCGHIRASTEIYNIYQIQQRRKLKTWTHLTFPQKINYCMVTLPYLEHDCHILSFPKQNLLQVDCSLLKFSASRCEVLLLL